jgi:PAS domain-containing protein
MGSPPATRKTRAAAAKLQAEPTGPSAGSPDAIELLESLPLGVALVDRDRRLHALNGVARTILEVSDDSAVFGKGVGDLIRCVNAMSQPDGCGRSSNCHDCVLWQVADEAIRGTSTSQREVGFRIREGKSFIERVFLVSASPYRAKRHQDGIAAVLVLQDVSHLHRLQGLLPICSACKRIRRDDSAWERLEQYIEAHSHALFTHSLCPSCMSELYPDLEQDEGPKSR